MNKIPGMFSKVEIKTALIMCFSSGMRAQEILSLKTTNKDHTPKDS
jgi:hypothetical protein